MNRIEKAMEIFNNGFTSKASKKKAIELVTREYEEVARRNGIMGKVLDLRSAGRIDDEKSDILYWGIPDLHNWKEKHSKMYTVLFPVEVAYIENLKTIRETFKNADIIKVERKDKEIDEKVKKVELTIKQEMERLNKQFINGLNLAKLFNGMSVYAHSHYVINQHGTKFIRTFYYLNGSLMALKMIIAIAENFEKKE